MLQPTSRVAIDRVTVSPMNHPSFRVPFVLSVELNSVTFTKRRYPWCEIDVVGNQNCLARTQTDYESLMTTAIDVIRENLCNYSSALNLNVAGVTVESLGQNRVSLSCTCGRRFRRQRIVLHIPCVCSYGDDECQQQLLHCDGIQRKSKGRAAFGASHLTAGLGINEHSRWRYQPWRP